MDFQTKTKKSRTDIATSFITLQCIQNGSWAISVVRNSEVGRGDSQQKQTNKQLNKQKSVTTFLPIFHKLEAENQEKKMKVNVPLQNIDIDR